MKFIATSILCFAAFMHYLFSEVGSNVYFLSIIAIVFLMWLNYGFVDALITMMGFLAWHYTNFSSDTWFEFLLLPLIAVGCFISAFLHIGIFQGLYRFTNNPRFWGDG